MYTLTDVSARTHRSLMFKRNIDPVGILLHTTDGVDSLAYLQGGVLADNRVASCDYLIVRTGHIYSLMPEGMAAYHAGVCRYKGKLDKENQASRELVGIELENYDRGTQVPTDAQHYATAALMLDLAHRYDMTPLHVYAHSGLAYPVGRRTDPKGLDYGWLFWLMEFMPSALTLVRKAG